MKGLLAVIFAAWGGGGGFESYFENFKALVNISNIEVEDRAKKKPLDGR